MLQNYLSRYNPIAPVQIETQLGYFERLIHMCKERKIPLMVANMPLGEVNRKVMAPGFMRSIWQIRRKFAASSMCLTLI